MKIFRVEAWAFGVRKGSDTPHPQWYLVERVKVKSFAAALRERDRMSELKDVCSVELGPDEEWNGDALAASREAYTAFVV